MISIWAGSIQPAISPFESPSDQGGCYSPNIPRIWTRHTNTRPRNRIALPPCSCFRRVLMGAKLFGEMHMTVARRGMAPGVYGHPRWASMGRLRRQGWNRSYSLSVFGFHRIFLVCNEGIRCRLSTGISTMASNQPQKGYTKLA